MKQLILVAAPPACGKTYVSRLLCQNLDRVAYFDKDSLSPLVYAGFSIGAQEVDMDGAFYATYLREAEYQTIFLLAREALEFIDTALINAPFGYDLKHLDLLRTRLEPFRRSGVRVIMVWLQSSPELCHANMIERASARDTKKLDNWEHYIAGIRFEPPQHVLKENVVDEMYILDRRNHNSDEREVQSIVRKFISRGKENHV